MKRGILIIEGELRKRQLAKVDADLGGYHNRFNEYEITSLRKCLKILKAEQHDL